MTVSWRPLTLAAALIVVLAAAATAQTVIVTKTVPGTSVDVGVNATSLKTATSDADGVARLPLDVLAERTAKATGKTEMDVRVFVDVCEKARRVWLVETGWQPPAPGAGCTRNELFGTFTLLKVTTLVVDAAEQTQAVWIRQGSPPASWLDPNAQPETAGGPEFPLPTGLVLFGGIGAGKYGHAGEVACGQGVPNCLPANYAMTFRVGGDFWLGRFLAVTGSYLKPARFKATGSGTGFRFTTELQANVATFGGKIALPAGRARLYAEGGLTYQRSNFQTTESINPYIATVDGEEVVFPGGTQELNLQTGGWGWSAGAGFEVWVKRTWGIYGEGGRATLVGSPRAGGEGKLDETLLYFVGGVRFRLGR